MSFPATILPHRTPKAISEQGPLMILQDRILQYLLLGAFVFGALGFAAVIPTALAQKKLDVIIFSSVLLVGTAVIILMRHLLFQARAGLFLAVFFLLEVQFLMRTGLSANTLVFLFGLVFYAGMFFGWEMSAVTLVLSLAAGMTTLFTPGHLSTFMNIPGMEVTGQLGFMVSLLSMLLICSSVVITHILLTGQYQSSLKNEHKVTQDLEDERKDVEDKLREQTDYYQHRLNQSRLASEISQAISSVLDPNDLLQTVADLMLDRFKLYYIGVFVLDNSNRYAVLRAGTGEAGRKMLADGHSLAVGGTSMIGWATLNKQPRIALDVGSEAVRFNNPHLPYTRSEIALPILAKGETLGALSVQSTQPNAFEDDDVTLLQSIANSLGVALENARLYQQTEAALDEVRQMNRNYLQKTWTEAARQHGELSFSYESPQARPDSSAQTHEFPLMLRDQVIGYITLESDQAELSEDEMTFIDAVTSQTAVALENARLLEETERHAIEEQTLNAMTEKFSQAVSVDEILQSALKELGELPAVAEVSIHLVPPAKSNGSNGQSGPNGHNGNGNGK